MQNYKDLKVWEKGHQFTVAVYSVTKGFPKEEIYSLTNQIRRAAASIPANIAEGCGKKSQNEFAHFLNIALGSSNEAEYFLLLAKDLGYLDNQQYEQLSTTINQIKGMLITLISRVREKS
jgi:four helix bundle protein